MTMSMAMFTLVGIFTLLGMALSLDQDIVLRFGDNSLRIEKDGEDQTEATGGLDGYNRFWKKKLSSIQVLIIQGERTALRLFPVY